jgi:NIMA (never in mitosis gene a)-related kinase
VLRRRLVRWARLTAHRTFACAQVKLLAHLMHVNVVKFYDNFVENGVMHIVMEYATGGTLYKQLVNRDGELLEEGQVWEWFVQV